MIDVAASITKNEIPQYAARKGKYNAAALMLAGCNYQRGTLRFCGFAGALHVKTGKYQGVLRWEPEMAPLGAEFCDVGGQPKSAAKSATKSRQPISERNDGDSN